jgi:hypothetical protein
MTTTAALLSLRSAISWAIRVNARWMAEALRMTVDSAMEKEKANQLCARSPADKDTVLHNILGNLAGLRLKEF